MQRSAGFGSLGSSVQSVKAIKRAYRHVEGVDRFLASFPSSDALATCTVDPDPDNHCHGAAATYLVTLDGRGKFAMPCGTHPADVPSH